ncbi:helix-hairpin-helix domain-containing protein [Halomicrobium katesii]|uniref:helix-hairpin-helix domain-containing protein n=1 Tax=Halomicrobium katesii TaxID=437163 RepID=UPI00037BFBFA|nr:helix-hairpin-helix domain-containing protein [Halomicrobium katesii]
MVDPWLVVAVIWAVAAITAEYDLLLRVADRLDPPELEPSPIDEAHEAYFQDRIDEDELERRLEILVDDRAKTIRDMADDTDGIGEEFSRDLAREFETVAELQGADVDDLQEIDGIGEKKAKKLREQLD